MFHKVLNMIRHNHVYTNLKFLCVVCVDLFIEVFLVWFKISDLGMILAADDFVMIQILVF